MHAQAKQANELEGSYNEGEKSKGFKRGGSNDQGQDTGSNASPALNPCIIQVE
jgi:hypothetical protein